MYELGVERTFRAAHSVSMAGRPEPSHRHEWRVEVVVSGPRVDPDGLLLDFHDLEERLATVLAPLEGSDLNTVSPFDRLNPTAELLARHIAERLSGGLPAEVALERVSVTEAPGCVATYRP